MQPAFLHSGLLDKGTDTQAACDFMVLQWFCEHNNLDPNLATDDVAEKVTTYMLWLAHNCPGYDYPKKPAVVVGGCKPGSACDANNAQQQPSYSLQPPPASCLYAALRLWPHCFALPVSQGKSTVKQAHAELKLRYEADHMAPPAKRLPYADLMDILEYKAAYQKACAAAEPEKGLRPDHDPQVRGSTLAGVVPACKDARAWTSGCKDVNHPACPWSSKVLNAGVWTFTCMPSVRLAPTLTHRASRCCATVSAVQEGTVCDTMDNDEVIAVLNKMLGSDRPSAPCDMSIATWMDMTIGRGDDARLVYLPDLVKPQLLRVIGVWRSIRWQLTYSPTLWVRLPQLQPALLLTL